MQNNHKQIIGVSLLIILSCFSCRNRKNTGSDGVSGAQIVEKYWENQLEYDYLSLRGNGSMTKNGSQQSFSISIRMKKDSVIWVTAGLFGFEGARILITQDSFKMMDKMNKTYYKYDRSYLTGLIGFDVTLGQLQNILVGNAPFNRGLYQRGDTANKIAAIMGSVANNIIINPKSQTYKSNITSSNRSESTDIQYDEYEKMGKIVVPKNINTSVNNAPSELSVVINYQSVNPNTISNFPFSIPDGYKSKN